MTRRPLPIRLLFNGLATLLGWLWRGYVGLFNRGLRFGGWWDINAQKGVLSLVQAWGGVFLDKGGAFYNARHPAFAGVDDDAVLANAIADGIADEIPVFLKGTWEITQPITDAAGRMTLWFSGRRNCTILYDGYPGDWIFEISSHKSEMIGGFLLYVSDVDNEYQFNGIDVKPGGSRLVIRGFPEIYRMKNGIRLTTVYGVEAELGIEEIEEIGIDFDEQGSPSTEANANTIYCQNLTGKTSGLGATGIRNVGHGNIVKSQQFSSWAIGYDGAAFSSGTMFGHFVESNTKNVQLAAGASLYWDCAQGFGGKMDIADGATFRTPWGWMHPSGLSHVPTTIAPLRYLTGFWPVTDASTVTIADRSGYGRPATKVGTWSSVAGPYGFAVSAGGSGGGGNNTIRLPTAALDSSLPWAIAVLVRPRAWVSGVNRMLTLQDGSGNYIFVNIEQDNVNMPMGYNGSGVSNLGRQITGTDEWQWVVFGYDPSVASGTIYNLNPGLLGYSVGQSAAPMTNIGATSLIEILGSGSVTGVCEVGAIALFNGGIPSRSALLHLTQLAAPLIVPGPQIPVYSDTTRPAAGRPGYTIFNTTDGKLNIDTGSGWTLADGTAT